MQVEGEQLRKDKKSQNTLFENSILISPEPDQERSAEDSRVKDGCPPQSLGHDNEPEGGFIDREHSNLIDPSGA